jgi:hypothetical protein
LLRTAAEELLNKVVSQGKCRTANTVRELGDRMIEEIEDSP